MEFPVSAMPSFFCISTAQAHPERSETAPEGAFLILDFPYLGDRMFAFLLLQIEEAVTLYS
jgi:hypothetical protein